MPINILVNQSIKSIKSFLITWCRPKIWLKVSLVLHTRELKEDNGKTKTKLLNKTESVTAVRSESSD